MTVPFKVYGHPRSGNHFLAAFLAENLVFDEDLSRTIERPQTGHWSRRDEPARYRTPDGTEREGGPVTVPYGKLLGGHAFGPPPPRSVYIFRDGRDVALSVYKWAKFRSKTDEHLTFSEWLRAPLDWRASPGQKHTTHLDTIADHWVEHVESWLRWGRLGAVYPVRYEMMLTDADIRRETLRELAQAYGLVLRYDEPLVPGGVGWNPSSDFGVGAWRYRMSEEDSTYILSRASPRFIGFWGDGCVEQY